MLTDAGFTDATFHGWTGYVTSSTTQGGLVMARKPVSGEMAVGVSNRGTMMGLGINIDLTKPKGALVSTRLEARIKDRTSGAVLWEGRADILTRQGDARWSDQKIAERLAAALFEGFPTAGA